MPVIDASVYIALINAHEKEHTLSWAWFEAAQAARLPVVAPVILLPEVAAALSRGTGDPQLASQVVDQLEHSGVVQLLPVTPALASRAASIAANHRIRGCDAIYVALADQLDDHLITWNQQQLERAAAIVKTYPPQKK
jgi:predicted nucleic acid-binding protein